MYSCGTPVCKYEALSSEDGYNRDASGKEQTPALTGLEALRLDLLPAVSAAFHLVSPVLVLGSTLASPLVVIASAGMASSGSSSSSSSSDTPSSSIPKTASMMFVNLLVAVPGRAHLRVLMESRCMSNAVLSIWVAISNWFKDYKENCKLEFAALQMEIGRKLEFVKTTNFEILIPTTKHCNLSSGRTALSVLESS